MGTVMGTFFSWLARTSWQAAVLVLIVLLIQSAFRKKLSARWRHALGSWSSSGCCCRRHHGVR